MAKRNKRQSLSGPSRTHSAAGSAPQAPAVNAWQDAVHPPAKNPTLLAVSIALFALWFAFLLVTALWG
jgi:hypothetical protein